MRESRGARGREVCESGSLFRENLLRRAVQLKAHRSTVRMHRRGSFPSPQLSRAILALTQRRCRLHHHRERERGSSQATAALAPARRSAEMGTRWEKLAAHYSRCWRARPAPLQVSMIHSSFNTSTTPHLQGQHPQLSQHCRHRHDHATATGTTTAQLRPGPRPRPEPEQTSLTFRRERNLLRCPWAGDTESPTTATAGVLCKGAGVPGGRKGIGSRKPTCSPTTILRG